MSDARVVFPQIDPSVEYVGVSALRQFNAAKLRTITNLVVISDNGKPLAVLVPYGLFMQMQDARLRGEQAGGEVRS